MISYGSQRREGASSTTLASRGVLCKTPPFRGENLLSGSDYWRDRRFRAQTRLGSHAVLTSRQEGFAMQLRGRLPNSRSGLIIADFTMFLLPWSPGSRTQGLCKSYRNFLSRCSFCPGGIPGLFFRDGLVIGLSGNSRSPCFPLGISVEDHVPEMTGLNSRLGLIVGDFRRESSAEAVV